MRLNNIGYLTKEGFKGIFKHGFMSFASVTIIMACLLIMGVFTLLAMNINSIISELEQQNEIVAFVDDSYTEAEAKGLKNAVLSVNNVESVEFVTRQEAMDTFAEDYDSGLFDEIDATTFRDRYIVHVTDISKTAQTKDDLEEVEGIAKVNAHLEYADGFIKVRNVVSIISGILVLILAVVSVFIMSNTIKLATFTRREEIAIMRMVGATNSFIRMPFIIEGLILGILGGGLAFLAVWGLYEAVCSHLLDGVVGGLISVVPFSTIMWPMLAVFLGVGIIVGVFGGNIAIRNYLKV
ncbi:MAG: permease-like cell division protein FtsX [Oscillospiraceae bacterium]|nr:permease-like cell division protein FtsX [Oscillospiraceae bacterium]MDY4105485.1 permease-like cell division protein FtsX [Oscillospiraceae bacterium]